MGEGRQIPRHLAASREIPRYLPGSRESSGRYAWEIAYRLQTARREVGPFAGGRQSGSNFRLWSPDDAQAPGPGVSRYKNETIFGAARHPGDNQKKVTTDHRAGDNHDVRLRPFEPRSGRRPPSSKNGETQTISKTSNPTRRALLPSLAASKRRRRSGQG